MGQKLLHSLLLTLVLLLAGCSAPGAVTEPTPPASAPASASPGVPASITPPSVPVPTTPAPPVPAGLRFVESEDGLLRVNLSLKNATITLNNNNNTQSFVSTVYNGDLVSPVWRLKRGDVLIVELDDNRFPVNDPANFTNIHFHGLNVPPQPPGDNVFVQVYPNGTLDSTLLADHATHHIPGSHGVTVGSPDRWVAPTAVGSYRYSILIPDDHPQGLFWWHAHPHGVSNTQVAGGMSGAMIIGNVTAAHYPQFANVKEQVVLLRDYSPNVSPTGVRGPTTSVQVNPPLRTINGAPSATFSIAENETQFWRFANVGANLDFDVAIIGPDNASVPFYVIAVDGNVLERVTRSDHLYLHPGARMEAFIVGPPAGTYTLQALETVKRSEINRSRNFNESAAPLGALVSAGQGPASSPADAINASRAVNPDERFYELQAWVDDGNVTVNRTVVFNATPGLNNATVNGRPYDPGRDDTNVTYGDTEIWTIVNPTPGPHVFHIHQLDFLVMSLNGAPVDARGLRDTVLIPPATVVGNTSIPSTVQIAIAFTEPHMIGRYVYHCHYLAHEDNGMMANVVVDYNATRGPPRLPSA